jgi:hypothetical protein
MPPQDVTGSELAQLFVDTGIDLTVLSAVGRRGNWLRCGGSRKPCRRPLRR